VKGSERVKFVKQVIFCSNSMSVIDLDECGCPTFDVLYEKFKNYKNQPTCSYLSHTNEFQAITSKSYNCSRKQAWAFKAWLNEMNQCIVDREEESMIDYNESEDYISKQESELSTIWNTWRNMPNDDDDDDFIEFSMEPMEIEFTDYTE